MKENTYPVWIILKKVKFLILKLLILHPYLYRRAIKRKNMQWAKKEKDDLFEKGERRFNSWSSEYYFWQNNATSWSQRNIQKIISLPCNKVILANTYYTKHQYQSHLNYDQSSIQRIGQKSYHRLLLSYGHIPRCSFYYSKTSSKR